VPLGAWYFNLCPFYCPAWQANSPGPVGSRLAILLVSIPVSRQARAAGLALVAPGCAALLTGKCHQRILARRTAPGYSRRSASIAAARPLSGRQ